MARRRGHSLLYGVLGGLGLFVLLPLLIALYFTWVEYTHSEDRIVFPAGTQVTRTNDYDGFPANGVATITSNIPSDKSAEFAQQLQKNRFQESPIPENIQLLLRHVSEAEAAAQVINGLWYFKDETPEEFQGKSYHNYLFKIYDLDACIYYSIEYDS